MDILNSLIWFLGVLTLVALAIYLIPQILVAWVWKPQDLKKKYNAKWAMVSGGSSGLGRALVQKLANQGLNIVIVALDDDLLKKTGEELKKEFPNQEFRVVGVDFGKSDHATGNDYYKKVVDVCQDIDVQIVFNNAGYLVMKAFNKSPIDTHLKNIETNSMCHIRLTHYFFNQMRDKGLKGCIGFTSSPMGFFPGPTVTYAMTKAFIEHFASCLAIEAYNYGIDVSVVSFGPMQTRFYDNEQNIPKAGVLDFFKSISSTPAACADVFFTTVGRLTVRDHSLYTIVSRLSVKALGMELLVRLISVTQSWLPDYKKFPDLH